MDPIKIAFFTHNSTVTATEHLRVLGPISYTDMEILVGTEYKNRLDDCINEAQLILIHRNFPEDYEFFSQVLQKSRSQNKPIIFDIDDNLFALPENHPDRISFAYSKSIMPMFEAILNADYVTVPNEYLKRQLSNLNQSIVVLPNYFDERLWALHTPLERKRGSPLIIGYMGGNTHKPDIEYIAPVLFDIKNQFPEKVRFHFYGLKPPDELLSFSDTIWTPIKTHNYKEFAKDFQQLNVDFFVAPLIDNEFNRCKSAIKFLEYNSLGVPGIFSNVTPYKEVITDNENGFLADSLEEWTNKILILLHDHQKGIQLVENAQKLVKEKYLMSNNSDKWKKAYTTMIMKGISEHSQKKLPAVIVKEISKQLREYHNEINMELRETRKSLENTQKMLENSQIEISTLQNEVLYYALSKSWQITRPLRKIMNIFREKGHGH